MSQVMVYTCDVCKRNTTQNLKRDGWLCVDITHGSTNLVEVRRWDVEQADRPADEDALHVCSVDPCVRQLIFETLFPPQASLAPNVYTDRAAFEEGSSTAPGDGSVQAHMLLERE